jgi:hypothetical protein
VRDEREQAVTRGDISAKGRAPPDLHRHTPRGEHPLMKIEGALPPT